MTDIMKVAIQESGKTTTSSNLAHKLLKDGRKPLLVAADIYRPAAVDQLKVLGQQLNVPVFHEPNVAPPQLAEKAYALAREQHYDVVIVDTAGRLAIDEPLMQELEAIKKLVSPDNTILVCDA